jgi:D-amino peptidase
VAGDAGLCRTVRETDPAICTVETNTCVGSTVIAEHPEITQERIRESAAEALKRRDRVSLTLPASFETETCFRSHLSAVKASWYPGSRVVNADTIGFDTNDYFEFLRFFMFVL